MFCTAYDSASNQRIKEKNILFKVKEIIYNLGKHNILASVWVYNYYEYL